MKVQRIDFKEENPAIITVEMTASELALVVKLTGRESGASLVSAGFDNLIMENNAVFDAGDRLFNVYYEDGVDGYLKDIAQ